MGKGENVWERVEKGFLLRSQESHAETDKDDAGDALKPAPERLIFKETPKVRQKKA